MDQRTFADLLGHIGYASLVLGTLLVAQQRKIGWPFRALGESLWVVVGFLTGLTSAWTWGLIFIGIDLHGYFKWRRAQKKAPTVPMWREEGQDYVVGYMDLIDFECELGGAMGGNTVYPSVEDLREHRQCVESCGIVAVEGRAREIIQPWNPDLDREDFVVPKTPETT